MAILAMGAGFNRGLEEMVMRKWVGFAAGVLLACGATGQAQAAQPSAQQVRQLFEVMHLSQAFGQMAAQIGTSLSRQMSTVLPCVPARGSYTRCAPFLAARCSKASARRTS